jgi:hypothetical protein
MLHFSLPQNRLSPSGKSPKILISREKIVRMGLFVFQMVFFAPCDADE